MKAADSPRWCETCQGYGDHHTDRHPPETRTPRWAIEVLAEAVYDAGHYPVPLPGPDGAAPARECSGCSEAGQADAVWPCPVALLVPEGVRAYIEVLARRWVASDGHVAYVPGEDPQMAAIRNMINVNRRLDAERGEGN